jgi:hypothetical protein
MAIFHHRRSGYFFGYGADQEEDMILAISGERPKIIGKAILPGYELRIQNLNEITTKHGNPQELLRSVWGDDFKSYVIIPKPGAQVEGVLFKVSLKSRNQIDSWELIQMRWYKRIFVKVRLPGSNRLIKAETQVLVPGQSAATNVKNIHRSWLMPKKMFLDFARKARNDK